MTDADPMSVKRENDVLRKALHKIRFEVESYFFDEEGVDSHEKFVDSFLENPADYTTLRDTLFEIDSILRDCDARVNWGEEQHAENQ